MGRYQHRGYLCLLSGLLLSLVVALSLTTPARALDYRIETMAEGLEHPFAMAFLPAGDILISERPGRLRLIRDGELAPEPIGGVPKVYDFGHAGLLDVVLHPDFAENRWLYFTLVTGNFSESALKLARAKYQDGKLPQLTDLELILETPIYPGMAVHFAGRMAFLADGTLLVATGDRSIYREQAQAPDSPLGKVLRIGADGTIPEDNPLHGGDTTQPPVWTLGHRNIQGLYVDPATGEVFSTEHGAQGGDELNLLRPGANHGWPLVTGGIDYSGGLITPFRHYPGIEPPLVEWTPSLAPSGLSRCRGCLWPEWQGDLFAGMLAGKQVIRIPMNNGTPLVQEVMFSELDARIRDVRFGPDGALYLLTDEDSARLLRVTPVR